MSVVEKHEVSIEAKGMYAETEWGELGTALEEIVKGSGLQTGAFKFEHFNNGLVDCCRVTWTVEGNWGPLTYLREAHDVLAEAELVAHSVRVEVTLHE